MLSAMIVEAAIKRLSDEKKNEVRTANYVISSIFVFFLDLCLIAPVIIMGISSSEVGFGLIPAIALAAYSFYKITVAIINYIRSRKIFNPTMVLIKQINIIGAIVSLMILQHALIMVNGGMTSSMKSLSIATSVAAIVVIIVFSIISFIRNKNLFKKTLGGR